MVYVYVELLGLFIVEVASMLLNVMFYISVTKSFKNKKEQEIYFWITELRNVLDFKNAKILRGDWEILILIQSGYILASVSGTEMQH